jgi:RNA polymerase sigma-70 factor (ECF subfamily)
VTFDDPRWLEEERTCLGALRRGDRAAFRRLYEVMAPPLYARVLLPRLGDAQAAEDVLAETFQRAIERLDGYQDRGGSIWSWLVTIASNRANDLHRERARDGRGQAGLAAMLAPLFGEAADDALDAERLRVAVTNTLERVNPRYRRALQLRFFEDRPRVECATMMEVKLGTFDVLLLRALRAFRAEWGGGT